MTSSRIQRIIELLEEEAKTINNPDPVSRFYAAEMRLQGETMKVLCKLSHKKRKKEDGN